VKRKVKSKREIVEHARRNAHRLTGQYTQTEGGVMSLEEAIAQLMLKMGKFEFFLVIWDKSLARRNGVVVTGVDWTSVGNLIELHHKFSDFDFPSSGFEIFQTSAHQYLTIDRNGNLKWDSDDDPISSWSRLMSRSYAQLRNNIAHGNKAQMSAPFTHDRTEEFIISAHALIDFIATEIMRCAHWETEIYFS
jgi:hypothetical protein